MWSGMPFWLQIGSRNACAPQFDSERIQIMVPRHTISVDSDLREYRTGGSRCREEGIQNSGPRREPVGRPKRPGFSATREGPLVGPAEGHGGAGANAWRRVGGSAAGRKVRIDFGESLFDFAEKQTEVAGRAESHGLVETPRGRVRFGGKQNQAVDAVPVAQSIARKSITSRP